MVSASRVPCLYDGRVGYQCRYQNGRILGLRNPSLCVKHARIACSAVRNGHFRSKASIPASYFSEKAIWQRSHGVRCFLFGAKGFVACNASKIGSGGSRLRRPLCKGHYKTAFDAVLSGRYTNVEKVPKSYFSLKARASRRKRAIEFFRLGYTRKRAERRAVLGSKCKFDGDVRYACGYSPSTDGAEISRIPNRASGEHRSLCRRHAGIADLYRRKNNGASAPDAYFSEDAISLRKFCSAKATGRAVRAMWQRLRSKGLTLIPENFNCGDRRLVVSVPKNGCILFGKQDFVCSTRRDGIYCSKHRQRIFWLAKRYGSQKAVPISELSESARARRVRECYARRRSHNSKMKRDGFVLVSRTGRNARVWVRRPGAGCRLHGQYGFRCGNPKNGRALLCSRHYTEALRLMRMGRYSSAHEIPDFEFKETSMRASRILERAALV